ncbi:MAG: serine protease [bacterium]|nr:serine protease [bacterium]
MRLLFAAGTVTVLFGCSAAGHYVPPDDERVPRAVEAAARSALRLILFPPARAEVHGPERIPEIEALVAQRRRDGTMSASDERLYAILVDDLRRAGAPRNLGPAASATAFVGPGRDRIITCRHNLEDFGKPAGLVGQQLQLVLVDDRGHIVVDSREQGGRDRVTVERIGDPGEHDDVMGQGSRTVLSDYAWLRVERVLDLPPVRVRFDGVRIDESVYVPHFQHPDGWPHDPRRIGFAVGRVTGPPTSATIYRGGMLLMAGRFAQRAVFTTCPGRKGASGAPMFDRQGRFLGMVTGGVDASLGIAGLPGVRQGVAEHQEPGRPDTD